MPKLKRALRLSPSGGETSFPHVHRRMTFSVAARGVVILAVLAVAEISGCSALGEAAIPKR